MMKSPRRKILFLFSIFLWAAAPAGAVWTATGCCSYTCCAEGICASGTGCGTRAFNSQGECQAALNINVCPTIPFCTVTFFTNGACVDNSGGQPTGGSLNGVAALPNSAFLPPGSLLGQSAFEQIAGGYHSLGDVSLMGTSYGDAFFTPRYTQSIENWSRELQERLQSQLEASREMANYPSLSPYSGRGNEPGTTRAFENAYADELQESDFFKQLQTRQTGPQTGGQTYMTMEELQRRAGSQEDPRLREGAVIGYPGGAEIPPDPDLLASLQDKAKEGAVDKAKEGADWLAEQAGIGKAYSDVKEAGGIYKGYVEGLEAGVEKAINCGVAGDMACYEAAFNDITGKTEKFTEEARDYTVDKVNESLSSMFGGLVDVGKEALESARKTAYEVRDKAKDMAGQAPMTWDTVMQAVKQVGTEKAKESGLDYAQGKAGDLFQGTRFPANGGDKTGGAKQ